MHYLGKIVQGALTLSSLTLSSFECSRLPLKEWPAGIRPGPSPPLDGYQVLMEGRLNEARRERDKPSKRPLPHGRGSQHGPLIRKQSTSRAR